jgi:hypothetical protein
MDRLLVWWTDVPKVDLVFAVYSDFSRTGWPNCRREAFRQASSLAASLLLLHGLRRGRAQSFGRIAACARGVVKKPGASLRGAGGRVSKLPLVV